MLDRRNQLRRTVSGAIVTGVLAGLVLALVELGWVFAAGTGPADPAGAARFALYVTGLLLGFGALAGAVEGILVFGLARAGAALGRRRTNEARWTARLYAAVLTPAVALFCAQLFRGRYARTIPFHDGVAVLIGLALLYAAFRGTLLALGARDRLRTGAIRPGRGRLLGLALLAAAVVLYAADQRVLPRLYPFLHVALAGGALLAAELGLAAIAVAGQRAGSRLGRLAEPVIALCLLVASAAGAVSALAGLGRSQGLRFVALEHTAAAQKVLAVAAATRIWRGHAVGPAASPRAAAPAAPLPQGPRLPGDDVFLISIDAVRADHVGAYGYARPTTPNIDALAQSGVVFDRVYAQVPHTSFSLSTLMTGKYLYSLAALGDRQRHETLPVILRRYGYKTAGFFPPSVFFIDAQKFTAYEESRFDFEYVKYEYLDAAQRVDQVVDFLSREQPQHVFVWTHFFEPHEPYEPHPGHDFGPRAIDRYDGEIAYVDAQVGRYVSWIRAHRPNAIIIVTADHGEEFGDHGGHYHATTVYDEQVRVPLVVNAPGVAPRHVAGQAELVDVPSTILGLLDLPLPVRMRGTDLTPWMADPPAPAAALPPAFAEVEHQKMVERFPDKLICDLGRGFCELYDLTSDPAEKRNLIDARPELAGRLRADLEGWIGSQLAYEQRPEELSGPERRRRALERGRLGDAGAIPELARLLGAADPPTRREAARLLRQLRAPAARAALARALGDADPEVRRTAAAGAAAVSPAGRQAALALLADAGAPADARLWAAIGLGDAGDPSGVPLLARAVATSCRIVANGSNEDGRCLGQIEPSLARDITVLLGTLKDRRAVADLLAARGIVGLRKEAVHALGLIGDRRAALPLARELPTEPRIEVRAELAAALARLADPRAAPAVAEAFAHETETQVARALFQTLAALGGGRGASTADLRRWEAGPRLVTLRLRRREGERVELWLAAAPQARGRVGVRVGQHDVGSVDLDPAERVYSVTVPAAALPARGPLHVTLTPEAGTPRLMGVMARALQPVPASRPAASQPAAAPRAAER